VIVRAMLLLASVATAATAAAQVSPPGPLWTRGDTSVQVTACPPGGDTDQGCRALAVRNGRRFFQIGSGYRAARLLWTRQAGADGPDLLVLGDSGGSGGHGDLFAVTVGSRPLIRRLSGERMDTVQVRPGPGPLRLRLAFDVEFFNGASHAAASIAALPVRWSGDDFALDPAALRDVAPGDLARLGQVIGRDLRAWAEQVHATDRLFPPEAPNGTPDALRSLMELVLAGHAQDARRLLHDAWPRAAAGTPLGGEDAFWAALCVRVVQHPLWRRFDLSRLPEAGLVTAATRGT
jgi:hypothetical protein